VEPRSTTGTCKRSPRRQPHDQRGLYQLSGGQLRQQARALGASLGQLLELGVDLDLQGHDGHGDVPGGVGALALGGLLGGGLLVALLLFDAGLRRHSQRPLALELDGALLDLLGVAQCAVVCIVGHRFRGRSVILIHHENRTGQPRGTSKREDVLDTCVRIQALEEDEAATAEQASFRLSFTKKREFFGDEAAPRILRLATASGVNDWSYEQERDEKRERIAELALASINNSPIAKTLCRSSA